MLREKRRGGGGGGERERGGGGEREMRFWPTCLHLHGRHSHHRLEWQHAIMNAGKKT